MTTALVHAIIPFGAVERAKTRLGAFLAPVQRQTLAVAMLHDVITNCDSYQVISSLLYLYGSTAGAMGDDASGAEAKVAL